MRFIFDDNKVQKIIPLYHISPKIEDSTGHKPS